jgi:ankyrin repeat protein
MDVLLNGKADPNLKDQQGRTPAELGIGHDYVIGLLADGGAEASNIWTASFAGRAELVKGFLAKDGSLAGARTPGGVTPLHFAARRGHVDVAELLLAYGADVKDPDGESKLTPLHWAVLHEHPKMVALLLDHQADRNAKSWDGRTPLDFAREGRGEETLRLLEHGR